jgi:flagellar M-ring protein FliF
VIAATTAIGYYASRPETEPLYVGLSQADVNRIGMALHNAGIPYDVNLDGTKIYVRRAQAPEARMLLAERGLPAGSTAGYELFDKLGPLGLTSFMQDVTRTRALEGELGRTIQMMKGVVSARVHIVIPASGGFRRNAEPTSASVVIRTEGPHPQSAARIIRHLVSSAVPSLPPENVSVMSTDGSVLAAAGEANALGSAKMIELEQTVARRAQENVRQTLAPYLGIDNFEVSVTARINLDKRQVQEQVYDPDSKAERSTRTIKEQGSSSNATSKQAVTVEQNVPTEQANSANGDQSRRNNERKDQTVNFELSSKVQTTVSEGHKIEALQVSLVVNRKKLSGSDTDRQLKEIEAIAASAAGIDSARGDKITIAAVEFTESRNEAPATTSYLDRLWIHLDTVIIAITALTAVLILVWLGLLPSVRTIMTRQWGAAASGQLPPPSGPAVLADRQSPGGEQVLASVAQAVLAPGLPRPNAVQNRLAELVEQDEKQVAEILKLWMVKT